jgi:hypothetical protein
MIFSEKDSRTNMIFCQLNLDAFTLVKYQTLHKQVYNRMKAQLKVPRLSSIKKDNAAGIEFKKN